MALHYLKYPFDLSDEGVLLQWVENPYWQFFSGEKFFQHEPPIDPSSMSRWRTRVGDAGAEQLLKESIHAYPYQVELLSRRPEGINAPPGVHLTPHPIASPQSQVLELAVGVTTLPNNG